MIVCDGFESHLYGIETSEVLLSNVKPSTFESHLYGIETRQAVDGFVYLRRLNRTFMELKHNIIDFNINKYLRFESHLYGIETAVAVRFFVVPYLFESHLYGIETRE